ncbi:hypothetical protein HYW20_02815 [Candidatus Woesearchaeota archaeon]|nr:hypothetical protein [Candidatus Woesearchaeota archaeon]
METTLTLKFKGMESELLNKIVESGMFNSKSEAIRAAFVKYCADVGLLEESKFWTGIVKRMREELQKDKRKPSNVLARIKRIKNENISG